MYKYLITGSAGFIGFHLTKALLEKGEEVVGLDNINDYYDPELKYARLKEGGINKEKVEWNRSIESKTYPNYRFIRLNLEDKENLFELFRNEQFDYVINLAAQAGVRYSIGNPDKYIQSNIIGFLNVLEACRHYPVKQLLYASSSSVYGNNDKVPFSETDRTDNPISLYAATKKSNELMAYTYCHLYKIPAVGLRFFTVYGPWGRPDMAIFKFTEAILNSKPIQVYAEGKLQRDFTYINDIISGIISILEKSEYQNPPIILNIGNHRPVNVNRLISEIEQCLKLKAIVDYLPMQAGDVNTTFADTELIMSYCDYEPKTQLTEGIKNFCIWYLQNYHRN